MMGLLSVVGGGDLVLVTLVVGGRYVGVTVGDLAPHSSLVTRLMS